MGYLVKTLPSFSKAIISQWFYISSEAIALPPSPPQLDGILPLLTFGDKNIRDPADNLQEISHIGIDCRATPFYLRSILQTNFNSDDSMARFNISGAGASDSESAIVTPDAWQHALISFDISGGWSSDWTGFPSDPVFASANLFTWSVNNVSKNNSSIGPAGNVPGLSDTKIIFEFGGLVAGEAHSSPGVSIPSGQFAIPTDLSDSVMRIKMAKLQVWTGRILDAGSVGSRRLFIDAAGRPVSRTVATAELGPPAICFDTSDDWINGRNRGTAGNFTKIGTINKLSTTVGL